jgi:hypothetical protein
MPNSSSSKIFTGVFDTTSEHLYWNISHNSQKKVKMATTHQLPWGKLIDGKIGSKKSFVIVPLS